jgi:hypothetical protein
MTTESLLASYPRPRQPLSPAYERLYVAHHRENRGGASVLQRAVLKMESWMHKAIAEKARTGDRVLEIGAGTLNHVSYETQAAVYDAVEPFRELYQHSPNRGGIRELYREMDEVSGESCYDRIVSIAVLEHVESLPRMVARAGLLLDANGCFQAGIPTEGGLLWGLTWRATTGVAFRIKNGLDYGVLMRWEHINTAVEIEAIVRHFFGTVRVRRFPAAPRHLSFYTVLEAATPNRAACRDFLSSEAAP